MGRAKGGITAIAASGRRNARHDTGEAADAAPDDGLDVELDDGLTAEQRRILRQQLRDGIALIDEQAYDPARSRYPVPVTEEHLKSALGGRIDFSRPDEIHIIKGWMARWRKASESVIGDDLKDAFGPYLRLADRDNLARGDLRRERPASQRLVDEFRRLLPQMVELTMYERLNQALQRNGDCDVFLDRAFMRDAELRAAALAYTRVPDWLDYEDNNYYREYRRTGSRRFRASRHVMQNVLGDEHYERLYDKLCRRKLRSDRAWSDVLTAADYYTMLAVGTSDGAAAYLDTKDPENPAGTGSLSAAATILAKANSDYQVMYRHVLNEKEFSIGPSRWRRDDANRVFTVDQLDEAREYQERLRAQVNANNERLYTEAYDKLHHEAARVTDIANAIDQGADPMQEQLILAPTIFTENEALAKAATSDVDDYEHLSDLTPYKLTAEDAVERLAEEDQAD